jgi:hypothetical protein
VARSPKLTNRPTASDPLAINARLYRQVSELLTQLEKGDGKVTLKERIAALVACGRLQTIFMGLRKEKTGEPDAGRSVRKYENAFQAHDARWRAQIAGPSEPDTGIDDPFDSDTGDDDDERESA